MKNIISYNKIMPKIDQSAFIAPTAIIAGDVETAKRLAEHHIVEASGTLATRLG